MDVTRWSANRQALAVAAAALVMASVLVLSQLAQGGWRVDAFVKFGAEGTYDRLATDVLGEPPVHVTAEDHDGTRFWVLARDPLLRHPDSTGAALDHPAYRAQRILYPWLVQPWRLGGEWALLWGMVVTNLLVVFGGTYAAARLALEVGATPWAGLVFALDPAILLAVMYDLADAVAVAGVVAFLLLVRRHQLAWAVVAAVAAVLAKELSLLPVLAVACFGAGVPRRARWSLAGLPVLVAAAWGVYERSRLGWASANIEGNLSFTPFGGWVEAWRFGWSPRGAYDDAVVAAAVLVLAVVVVVRWWRRRSLELLACLPVALTVPFLGSTVLNVNINALRAATPMLVLVVIDWFASRSTAAAGGRARPLAAT